MIDTERPSARNTRIARSRLLLSLSVGSDCATSSRGNQWPVTKSVAWPLGDGWCATDRLRHRIPTGSRLLFEVSNIYTWNSTLDSLLSTKDYITDMLLGQLVKN